MLLNVSSKLMSDLEDYVICLESAASLNGMTTFDNTPLTVSRIGSSIIVSSNILELNENKRGLEHCRLLREGLWITNEQRTICDLIDYERSEEWIYEAIESYDGSMDLLFETAEKYGVLEKLKYYLETM